MTKYDVNFTDRKYVSDEVKALINPNLKDKEFNKEFNKFMLDELNKVDKPSKEVIQAGFVQVFSCYDSFLTDRQKTAVVEAVQAVYQTMSKTNKASVVAGLTVINLFI
ncbi:MAG: hypothetical protein MJ211_09595 [Bacteroidales bacterium]|nr:hypothetical protein [Bacteroidales bacterium]